MLHGRRLIAFLFLAVMALPFAGLDLFGQGKDEKKKDEAKKTEQKKDEKKDAPKDPTKVTLAWKFEKNKPFYQTMTTKTDQTMKVMNNDVTQKQEQTFYFSWTPLEEKDGKWTLEQKILGVKMDIDIGGSPIKYDSTAATSGNANNPLSEFFKALVGSTFKVTVDAKTYKITKIEGREEFIRKLGNANKQMEPLLNRILSEDALREMAEPTFAVVPTETVEKGKTWTKETPLDMGPIGKYTNKYTYKYEGPDEKTNLDKIDVDSKLTYSPPEKSDGVGGLPFRIKSAKLESKSAKGTVWFNRDKGRADKTDMKVELSGTLEIEIGGQQTKVDLSQTQTTSVQTSDTNPIESKPAGK
jgi:hypothetical protein